MGIHLPLLYHQAMYLQYHKQILNQILQIRIFLTIPEEHTADVLE